MAAAENPAWFHNLVANPAVTVEIGTDTVPMVARVAAGAERQDIWDAQQKVTPGFVDYEAKTGREIPVVLLEPAV